MAPAVEVVVPFTRMARWHSAPAYPAGNNDDSSPDEGRRRALSFFASPVLFNATPPVDYCGSARLQSPAFNPVFNSAMYSEIGMVNLDLDGDGSDGERQEGPPHALLSSSGGSFNGGSSPAPEAQPPGGKIGTWMLVGLTYYAVSGGPLGLEIAVKAGGPFLTILGFTVTPAVWACSEAALTTELAIAYPEASGYCAWLNAAFGPYSSFLCSSLHYVSGVLDNALYPVSSQNRPHQYWSRVSPRQCHG